MDLTPADLRVELGAPALVGLVGRQIAAALRAAADEADRTAAEFPEDPLGVARAWTAAAAMLRRRASAAEREDGAPGECAICGDPLDHDGRPHALATGDGRARADTTEGKDPARA